MPDPMLHLTYDEIVAACACIDNTSILRWDPEASNAHAKMVLAAERNGYDLNETLDDIKRMREANDKTLRQLREQERRKVA